MSENIFRLVVVAGPDPGRAFALILDTVTLGRDPQSDIILNDPEVSRQHVRLARQGDGYTIQDLGSTNGTFLNGERLTGEARELAAGQMVGLGSTVSLRYEAGELEPIPDPQGMAETDEAAEVAPSTVVPAVTAVLGDPRPESAAEESAKDEPAAEADPFSDPAWREALAPRPMPEFRFDDDGEAVAASVAPELATQAPEPEAAVPSFASYQPEAPLAGVEDNEAGGAPPQRRRRWLITVGVIALLICCCCALLVVFLYQAGDGIMYEICRDAAAGAGPVPEFCDLYLP